jgi:hypothetical protein
LKSVQLAKRGFVLPRGCTVINVSQFLPPFNCYKNLRKDRRAIFYHIKLLQKVLRVVLGIGATFCTGRFWCSRTHSGRWTIFNARRLRIWIEKKRRALIPVISLYKLSQSIKSSQKENTCKDKRINSSLLLGGYPLY